jgi:hypothetical protein
MSKAISLSWREAQPPNLGHGVFSKGCMTFCGREREGEREKGKDYLGWGRDAKRPALGSWANRTYIQAHKIVACFVGRARRRSDCSTFGACDEKAAVLCLLSLRIGISHTLCLWVQTTYYKCVKCTTCTHMQTHSHREGEHEQPCTQPQN